jgi:hypothetical protein
MGYQCGYASQGSTSVAIGYQAGWNQQGTGSVAFGYRAGSGSWYGGPGGNPNLYPPWTVPDTATGNPRNQGNGSVAVGYESGQYLQGNNAVSMGYQAGQTNQGNSSIAIGNLAARQDQGINSIVINATGVDLANTVASSTVIKPLRGAETATGTFSLLQYNVTSGEIAFSGTTGAPTSSGNLSKTFVIDHPVKNENYLVHACLEGPESGVYYRGEGKISFGESTIIKLPDYADALATDFTVQVTPIGKPRVLGVSRVRNGQFEVYCKEHCEFFWTVLGKRGNIVVEPKKSESFVNGDGPYRWIK